MKDELIVLAQLRQKIEQLSTEKHDLELAIKATDTYRLSIEVTDKLQAAKREEESTMETIRALAVEKSKATGYEVRKFDKVEVKAFTTLKILDEKRAIQWAAVNAPSTLSLKKEFDKVAKSLELDFVEVSTEYRGQIASDLSSLLIE